MLPECFAFVLLHQKDKLYYSYINTTKPLVKHCIIYVTPGLRASYGESERVLCLIMSTLNPNVCSEHMTEIAF